MNSVIHLIVSGICDKFDDMRTWLLSPDIKLLQLFELDISQALDCPKYHNMLSELFRKHPGFDYLHHQVPGS